MQLQIWHLSNIRDVSNWVFLEGRFWFHVFSSLAFLGFLGQKLDFQKPVDFPDAKPTHAI